MAYVDGFLVPVPKRHRKRYRDLSREAAKVWLEHGALACHECLADDVGYGGKVSFTQAVKLKKGEEVWFSWILYKSRKDRDRVNSRALKDPRLLHTMIPGRIPHDLNRMAFGGFRMMVNQRAK